MNIILSDLCISSVGIGLDIIGSLMQGRRLTDWFCKLEGTFHTTFGKYLYKNGIINLYPWSIILYVGVCHKFCNIYDFSLGLFVQYISFSSCSNDCYQKQWQLLAWTHEHFIQVNPLSTNDMGICDCHVNYSITWIWAVWPRHGQYQVWSIFELWKMELNKFYIIVIPLCHININL